MLGEPFDQAGVLEETAPRSQSAVRRERRVGAGGGDFARQRVQSNVVLVFPYQVKRNQRGRGVHHPQCDGRKPPWPSSSIAVIGLNDVFNACASSKWPKRQKCGFITRVDPAFVRHSSGIDATSVSTQK